MIVSAWNPATPRHGAGAVPLPVPVLRRRRPALLPALPALGRHLPRRAVQHRQLRAADDDDGAGDGSASRASSCTRSATRTSISTTSSRRTCSCRARRARCRACTINPEVKVDLRLPLRGFHARRLRPASPHQGPGRGLGTDSRSSMSVTTSLVVAVARERRHRPRRRAAVAHAVGPEDVPPAHHGQAHRSWAARRSKSIGRPLDGRDNIVVTRDPRLRGRRRHRGQQLR